MSHVLCYLAEAHSRQTAGSPSGKIDMSMQLSATPAAKTLAVTEAFAAPGAGVCPGSLNTDAHSPACM